MAISNTTLTLTQPGKKVLAADNPIVFNISTAVVDTAAFARVSIRFLTIVDANPVISAGFNIKIKSHNPITGVVHYEETFYASERPVLHNEFLCGVLKDEQGNTIGNPSAIEIASSLATLLSNDPYLSKYYTISQPTGAYVIITSKAASENYYLTVTADGSFGDLTYRYDQDNLSEAQADTEGAQIDDYKVYLELYTPSDSAYHQFTLGTFPDVSYDKVAEFERPYHQSNKHQFDVSEVCKSFVRTSRPDFSMAAKWNEVEYQRPFRVRFGEIVSLGDTGNKIKIAKGLSSTFYAFNASLPRESANDMSPFTGTTSAGTFKKFLTNAPSTFFNPRKTSRYAKDLLYLMIQKDLVTTGDSLVITAAVYYWDGTVDENAVLNTTQVLFFASDGNYGCVYRLNVSYDSIGLKELEESTGKKIKKVWYRVYKNWSTQMSDNYYFEYPYNEKENDSNFHIAFLNKLGTYDTFTCKGLVEETLERTKNELTLPMLVNNDGSLSKGHKHNAQYDVKVTKKITVNTGWISKEVFEWLEELISSNDIYQYKGTNELNYLMLESHKYSKSTSNDDYNIEFTFVQTIYSNNVSI